jgi:hypothetical protein
MSRVRIILSVIVAVLSAFSAGSASANWFVNGAELKTTAALSAAAKEDGSIKFLVPEIADLTVECAGAAFDAVSPEIVGPGATGRASSLRFLSCNTTKPPSGCALEEANETIATTSINVKESLATGTEDRILFTPQTGKTFTEVRFNESNTCPFDGIEPIKGSVAGSVPTGQTEAAAQALVALGSVENNSLEVGAGNKVQVTGGRALQTLVSGSKWSFK